jgi:DNA-directed RNA polymerase specialized sigma24 family protein
MELVGAYSPLFGTSAELADLRKWIEQSQVRRDARQVRRQKIPRRLSSEQISELIQEYREGLTVYELAARFGIHRETASGVLEREGVPRRRKPLSSSQTKMASVLYGEGWSLARMGAELGCDPSTVWRTLVKIGGEAPRN